MRSETWLDLRELENLNLDDVLAALQNELAHAGDLPKGIIISVEQDEALIAEWKGKSLDEERPPETLHGATLWGEPVEVR